MGELQFTLPRRQRTLMDLAGVWLVRMAVALFFVTVGWSKFPSDGMWVRIFDQIGLGQWFRSFTGVVQVAGAVLLIVPRVAWLGAAILFLTMLGAAAVQIAVLQTPLLAIAPAVLMVITAALVAQARGWLVAS